MLPPLSAHILLVTIVALSILLMLVRPRRIAEVWWIGAGAALLLVLRLIPLTLAGRAIAEGTDVYLFLTGMMLLSELARMFGVFDWVASVAVEHARGSCVRLFTMIYAAGTVVTILMSNDATAVVLTPAVFSAVRRSKANPLPNLFACAFIANAASFVLPISNPANLVVFRSQMPPLLDWVRAFGLPSLLSIVSTYAVLRWWFRNDLACGLPRDQQPTRLTGNGRLVLIGIVLTAVVLLIASAMKWDLGLPTFVCAVVVAIAMLARVRVHPMHVVRDISWSVLPLVAGLFILVEAIDSIGAMRLSAAAMEWAERLPAIGGAMVAAGAVGIGNNLVNNLPLGLIAGSTLKMTHAHGLIANAVLIAVDLGPNLSVTGSLATILCLGLRQATLAVAESCTGGLVAQRITAIPGSSRSFLGGAVVYSNELKTSFAGVPAELIEQHGAVSEEVARALAIGIRERTGATIGLAITGIAGPTGGTETKPAGLVYIGVSDANRTDVLERNFRGPRQRVRDWTAQQALDLVRRRLM